MVPSPLPLRQDTCLGMPDMTRHLNLTQHSAKTPFLAKKRPFFSFFGVPKSLH